MTIIQAATQFGILNQTAEQIADTLSAVTSGPISVSALRFWLRDNGLLYRNVITNALAGSLVSLMADGSPFQAGLVKLAEHVFDDQSETVATHQPTWALQAAQLLSGLAAAEVVTAEHVSQFYALDGGLLFPDGVTAQQVEAAIAAQAATEQAVSLDVYFTTKYENPVRLAIQTGVLASEADVDTFMDAIVAGG